MARGGRNIAERLAVTMLGADPRVAREPDGRWRLAGEPGPATSPALSACRFAVVDVETTGAAPTTGGRVIEIAVAVLQSGRTALVFQSLVNAGVALPPVVAAITGIRDAELRAAPSFAQVADEVLAALAGSVFVAHNVAHDWAFVSAELVRTRDCLLAGPRLCTVRLARRLLPAMESRSLDAVTAAFGIEIARRHRAGDDALATAEVLRRLLAIAGERGVGTLAELQNLKKPKPA